MRQTDENRIHHFPDGTKNNPWRLAASFSSRKTREITICGHHSAGGQRFQRWSQKMVSFGLVPVVYFDAENPEKRPCDF